MKNKLLIDAMYWNIRETVESEFLFRALSKQKKEQIANQSFETVFLNPETSSKKLISTIHDTMMKQDLLYVFQYHKGRKAFGYSDLNAKQEQKIITHALELMKGNPREYPLPDTLPLSKAIAYFAQKKRKLLPAMRVCQPGTPLHDIASHGIFLDFNEVEKRNNSVLEVLRDSALVGDCISIVMEYLNPEFRVGETVHIDEYKIMMQILHTVYVQNGLILGDSKAHDEELFNLKKELFNLKIKSPKKEKLQIKKFSFYISGGLSDSHRLRISRKTLLSPHFMDSNFLESPRRKMPLDLSVGNAAITLKKYAVSFGFKQSDRKDLFTIKYLGERV